MHPIPMLTSLMSIRSQPLHSDLQPAKPHAMYPNENRLEFAKRLDSLASSRKHAENIESDL
jgi:hypothetical protein